MAFKVSLGAQHPCLPACSPLIRMGRYFPSMNNCSRRGSVAGSSPAATSSGLSDAIPAGVLHRDLQRSGRSHARQSARRTHNVAAELSARLARTTLGVAERALWLRLGLGRPRQAVSPDGRSNSNGTESLASDVEVNRLKP